MKMNALRKARAKSGLTLQQLADKSGLNPSTISAIEQGHRLAYPSTLAKLAVALNCELEDFEELAYSGEDDSEDGESPATRGRGRPKQEGSTGPGRGGARKGAGRKKVNSGSSSSQSPTGEEAPDNASNSPGTQQLVLAASF